MSNHRKPPVSKPRSTHPHRPLAAVTAPATSTSPMTMVPAMRPGDGETTVSASVRSTLPSVWVAIDVHKRGHWCFRLGGAAASSWAQGFVVVSLRMERSLPRLVDALPALAAALRESLLREGEPGLAAQLETAQVHALCRCDDRACLGVYLAPEREPCGDAYRVVMPDAVITLGVCHERLDWIDDNELLTPAGSDPRRRAEYEALRPLVPSRLP